MRPPLRKLALTVHIIASVGWLGAVGAYLALAIAGMYEAMELLGWYVIVPSSLAALVSGLVQALATEWGLFRHYWVITKLVLTVVGSVVLVGHLSGIGHMPYGGDATHRHVQLVVHAGGGLLLLVAATVLSVFKPWGRRAP
jgi:hypothetical protein